MSQCDNCLDEIDDARDTHVRVVKPMEFKGETREITQFFCSIDCLLEKLRG